MAVQALKYKIVRNACGNGEYADKLVTVVPIKKGEVVGSFKETMTITNEIKYSSVQLGKDQHLELNSDLVFMNHSCDPSVHMDTENFRVVALRDLPVGADLTFFYPTTEWDMAQPFPCWCGAKNCLKKIAGAKYLTLDQVKIYPMNKHILDLMNEAAAAK
eukprot:Partr_v1_DN28280_c0_g1_i10_m75482 putative Conserved hypothetical protein